MATYKNINGTNIPIRASDPSNPILGEIWYNTTSNTLKGQGYGTASWATAPVMNEARAATASFGTQTSGVAATGLDVPITGSYRSTTEKYDGTSWTNSTSVPTPRGYANGGGTETAGIVYGGDSSPGAGISSTEEYSGTAYTAGGVLPNAYYLAAGTGPQIATITIGGSGYPTAGPKRTVSTYDGTSWAASPATYPAELTRGRAVGDSSSAFVFGGSPNLATSNTWDGSSFAGGPTMNVGRMNMVGFGTVTDAVTSGGTDTPSGGLTTSETYNGTAWATGAVMPVGKNVSGTGGGAGTASAGLAFSGEYIAPAITLEYTGAGPVTQTISSS
jgi:hypothetical protein